MLDPNAQLTYLEFRKGGGSISDNSASIEGPFLRRLGGNAGTDLIRPKCKDRGITDSYIDQILDLHARGEAKIINDLPSVWVHVRVEENAKELERYFDHEENVATPDELIDLYVVYQPTSRNLSNDLADPEESVRSFVVPDNRFFNLGKEIKPFFNRGRSGICAVSVE
jgi:hypothetical protein